MNRRCHSAMLAVSAWLVAVIGSVSPAHAVPLGPGITYQGRLNQAGVPANGSFNLVFTLWDAPGSGNPPVGGAQIGGPDAVTTTIVDGLFTVQINDAAEFGAAAFDGQSRWLQISVNGTALGPRQPLTAAPYALRALSAPGGSGYWTLNGTHIYNNNTGKVGVGISNPDSLFHVADGSAGAVTAYSHSTATFERSSYSYISILSPDNFERGVLFGDPESNVNGGIIYNNSSTTDGFQFRTGGNVTHMVLTSAGNLGVGTTTPTYPLQIQGNAGGNALFAAGSVYSFKALGETGSGLVVSRRVSNSPLLINNSTQIDGNAIDAYNLLGGIALNLNGASNGNVYVAAGGGNVGVGTTSPDVKLHILGGTDSAPAGGGYLVLGSTTSLNVSLDNNEIMARNNGVAATLALNASGGNVTLCQNGGAVAVGTSTIPSGVRLAVDGKVLCEELEVQLSQDWPDYVFADDYRPMPLSDVEAYVRRHRHLPGVRSADDVQRTGVGVGEMQVTLLRKVEEMTLHMIELNKQVEQLRRDNAELRARLTR